MAKGERMRFAIYSRKSVYTGKGESISNQVTACKEHIMRCYPDTAEQDILFYQDEGYTGANTNRPMFQKMLAEAKEKGITYIVCYRLDRVSRNIGDFAFFLDRIEKLEIHFISVRDNLDSSNSMGKIMMMVASAFAQLERDTIADRVRDNMMMLARTGRWLGGTTPFGFTSEKIQEYTLSGKTKTCCCLKEIKEEMAIVKMIYCEMLALRTISGVKRALCQRQIKTRQGKDFSLLGIKEILQNPVYCKADKEARRYFITRQADVCFEEEDCSSQLGLLSYNKRDYKKKNAVRLPVSQWVIAQGKHQGVISGKRWIEVQELLDANKPRNQKPKQHNHYSLLSGQIVCMECGGRMFAKAHSNREKNGLFYYICRNKVQKEQKCHSSNLNGPQTDEAVYKLVQERMKSAVHLPRLCEELMKRKEELWKKAGGNTIQEIEKRIIGYNKELDTIINTALELSKEDFHSTVIGRMKEKAEAIAVQIQELEEEKKRMLLQKEGEGGKETQARQAINGFLEFFQSPSALTLQEKGMLIQCMVQKLEWDGENLHVYLYKRMEL